jgi:hypothetical protein
MSEKVLKLAGKRPMLLAIIVMATFTLGLLFSGWLTPTRGNAQQNPPDPTPTQENCAASTNVLSGTCPAVVANSLVSPTSIIVCYSNAPTMPTTIIAPVYGTNNLFTLMITDTNCNTTTNTENVTYTVSGVFWTNITTAPYTNFPANVTNSFTADADVFVTSSDTNICPSPGLINLATVSWYSIQVTVDAPDYDPDATNANANVKSMDSCGCGLGDATIWWFNGEDLTSHGYTMSTKATVTGAPNGALIAWTVTGPATFTGGDSSITITGTGPSAEHGVIITATVNGTQVCQQFLTVQAPASLKALPIIDQPYKGGYLSQIHYQILDLSGAVLPHPLPWNEDIDGNGVPSSQDEINNAAIKDYSIANGDPADENWVSNGDTGYDPIDPSDCADYVGALAGTGKVPTPLSPPTDPTKLSGVKVCHWSAQGSLHVGSATPGKGVLVKTLTWQKYLDHGRHLSSN